MFWKISLVLFHLFFIFLSLLIFHCKLFHFYYDLVCFIIFYNWVRSVAILENLGKFYYGGMVAMVTLSRVCERERENRRESFVAKGNFYTYMRAFHGNFHTHKNVKGNVLSSTALAKGNWVRQSLNYLLFVSNSSDMCNSLS